jgi:hypothetical protein
LKHFGLGNSIPGKADPARQLNVSQAAARSLDIWLEQIHRLAVLEALFATGLSDLSA